MIILCWRYSSKKNIWWIWWLCCRRFPNWYQRYYQRNNNNGFYSLNRQTNTVNGLSTEDASKKLVASIGPGKAYVRGYEIVNKETKYITLDKARDVLERDNVTIKGQGLSQFKITNVYGSVPLGEEGSELTKAIQTFIFIQYLMMEVLV